MDKEKKGNMLEKVNLAKVFTKSMIEWVMHAFHMHMEKGRIVNWFILNYIGHGEASRAPKQEQPQL